MFAVERRFQLVAASGAGEEAERRQREPESLRGAGGQHDAYQAAVDACEDCIGVNSCLSTTFNCPSCNAIVP